MFTILSRTDAAQHDDPYQYRLDQRKFAKIALMSIRANVATIAQQEKVFWFFFSKKNGFSSLP
jgi:hypothetical protein